MQALIYAAIFLLARQKGCEASPRSAQNAKSGKESRSAWSNELTQRLKTHFCEPGVLLKDVTLLHGLKAGTLKELGRVKDVEVCVLQCCESHPCELALFMNDYCYGITCYSQQHCKTVPSLGSSDKMDAVFLHKTTRNNVSLHIEQKSDQSKATKSPKKSLPKFVFYPVDSDDSKDLAFSVNLRRIASHYTDDEGIKRVLTAKANEHLASSKLSADQNFGKTIKEVAGKNESSGLDQFFSRDQVGSKRNGNVKPKSHIERKKILTHQKDDLNRIDWNSKLLKAAISSSSVAVLIVVLVLLATSRKKADG